MKPWDKEAKAPEEVSSLVANKLWRIAVIVSGSRRLRTPAHRRSISDFLWKFKSNSFQHVVVLHGAQTGGDLITHEVSRSLGFDSWGVPYFTELDGPGFYPGGPRRNECVVDVACVLRDTGLYRVVMGAFPDAESRGTWHAVRYAKEKGIVAEEHPQ